MSVLGFCNRPMANLDVNDAIFHSYISILFTVRMVVRLCNPSFTTAMPLYVSRVPHTGASGLGLGTGIEGCIVCRDFKNHNKTD